MFVVEIKIQHEFSQDTLADNPTYGEEDRRPFLDGVGHFFRAYAVVYQRKSFMGFSYKKVVLELNEFVHIAKYPKATYYPALAYQELSKYFIENGEDMINKLKEEIAERMVLRGLVEAENDFSNLIEMHLEPHIVFETEEKEVNALYKQKLERNRVERAQS